MKEQRHPHPHKDPRQPRHESKPGTNPPVFVWKPLDGQKEFRLAVARDAAFSAVCLDLKGLTEPAHLPEKAFAHGRYFWKWSAAAAESEVFTFELTPEAVILEVPPAGEWLRRFPQEHPRLYVRPEDVPALRASRHRERAAVWTRLQAVADALLAESHELAEPPFLSPWAENYQKTYEIWARILWESRRFVKGAETLALAYLASGDAKYARAACQRMASVSRWNPEGSSHISHNDEAHMSVIWHGTQACDWGWEQFTDEERARVIDQFRRRGQITYDHMHNRGSYGVTRFDSHAGREIVFLAQIAFVFQEHIPEARTWLEWLRPVLCGIWPIWAGDDGAWSEGLSYSLAYVDIMTMFATALKRGAGIDLYRRPFWKNHARWRQWCMPPYAEWIGFGDHTERWEGTWLRNADLVEVIDRETGANEFSDYVAALRAEAHRSMPTPPERKSLEFNAQVYLAPTAHAASRPAPHDRIHLVFPAAGWAAIRTHLDEPSRDLALTFRSSPFGAFSHSHANNNDFILHVGGKVMAMPSGYYDGYGSDHHAHWVWHTKSHNCVTLSDAGQLMRSHESRGAVENAFEDERLVYFRGNADASYRDRAARCRRHVFFLKPSSRSDSTRRLASSCFVLIDEFVAAPGITSALQWNIHSWNRFAVDEARRTFLVERGQSTLEGHFLYHHNAFFTLTEGWDPPPMPKPNVRWHPQYHLRFRPSAMAAQQRLGVALCPGLASLGRANVVTERAGAAEVARIGDDLVLVNQGRVMEYQGRRSEALALLVVGGQRYELNDDGVLR